MSLTLESRDAMLNGDDEVRREQMEDAAFWVVENEDGVIDREPIDEQALYGWRKLGGRGNEDLDIPHRNYLRSLETAITTVREGDRVRVNDGGWMDVTKRTAEGFRAIYENGSVEYEIWHHYTPERANTDSGPRMFKVDGFKTRDKVWCLEVDWRH